MNEASKDAEARWHDERREAARAIVAEVHKDVREMEQTLAEWDLAGRPNDMTTFHLGIANGVADRWREKIARYHAKYMR